ncbi:MAG: PQQ-binding-like beta-propeller repeat protein, partial [Gemmataceae bacterium]
MRTLRHITLTALTGLSLSFPTSGSLQADDWPQWLGPNRDAVWSETGILERFPAEGPKKLWQVPSGGGYAGPAIAKGRVYHYEYIKTSGVMTNNPSNADKLKGEERLRCLDLTNGSDIWTYSYPCEYSVSYPCGPRATPTVVGDRLYALGTMGHLACLNITTGKAVWSKELMKDKDYNAKVPIWGFASHPLVHGDTVYVLVG